MSGKRSLRSKDPVSYVESVEDPDLPQNENMSDPEPDYAADTVQHEDPDYIVPVDLDSFGDDDDETNKENMPAKKRKTLHDFVIKGSPVAVSISNKLEKSCRGITQVPRLEQMQKAISDRGRESLTINDDEDESYQNLLCGIDGVRSKSLPMRSPSASSALKTPKSKGRKSNKIDGSTVEQWRRQLGNNVKSHIKFKHYAIAANTHFIHDFSLGAFRALIVPNASKVHPADFDETTPVVVASTNSSRQAGTIFGSSKISGGSRYGSWSVTKADFVYIAATKQLRVWWTMGNEH